MSDRTRLLNRFFSAHRVEMMERIWFLRREDREEVIDDAHLRIYDKLSQGRYSFSTWRDLGNFVYRCVHNEAVDRLRYLTSNRRVEVLNISDQDMLEREYVEGFDNSWDVLEGAIDEFISNKVTVGAMKRHYVHGDKLKDIAGDEGVSINTVKSWLKRGRDRLVKHREEIRVRIGHFTSV